MTQSRAWWEAFDRHDAAAFTAPMGPAFVLFEDQRFYDRALLEKSLKGRAEKQAPVRKRTWSDERVFLTLGSAVYIGRALETLDGKQPIDGWNTIVWRHDGSRWVITHAQWSRGGTAAERDRWNEIFAQGTGFNTKPNQLLVDTVKGKKAGTALDIAMGQGRNAVFLAAQGWKTTGIDISDEGVRVAKAAAAEKKVKLDALLVDIDNYDYGKNKWDLITLIYAGDDAKLVEKVKPALRKGGLFVCEYFHEESDVAKAGAGGWGSGELAALFKDGFEVVRDDVVEDTADWAGMRRTKLVRFVARKK